MSATRTCQRLAPPDKGILVPTTQSPYRCARVRRMR